MKRNGIRNILKLEEVKRRNNVLITAEKET
jgi:hypothetical protein